MVMKANGGKRLQLGQFDTGPSKAYVVDGSIAVSDDRARW